MDTINVLIPADFGKVEHNGFELTVADIAPAGIAYLLQYGFAKSLQDSVSGRAKAMAEAKVKATGAPKYTQEEIDADIEAKIVARVGKILKGELDYGPAGSRLTGLARVKWDVAEEWVKAAIKAKGAKAPKGDEWKALVESYIAKYDAKVTAEAERRSAVPADGDDELDGLL